MSTQLRAGRTPKFIFAFGPEMSYIGRLQALEGNISRKREMFHDKNCVMWEKIFSEGAKPIYKLAVGNSSLFYETSKLPADEGFLRNEVSVTAVVVWNTTSGTRGTNVVLDSSFSFLIAVSTLKVKAHNNPYTGLERLSWH